MRGRFLYILAGLSVLVSSFAGAATPQPQGRTLDRLADTRGTSSGSREFPGMEPDSTFDEELSAPGPKETVFGKYELRPTWTTNTGYIVSENNFELGYQFNPDLKLLYAQSVNFDMATPGVEASMGSNVVLPDARVELDLNNIWTSKADGLALDYQPRVHVPTDAVKRGNGMVTFIKNQINLTKTYSPAFSFTTSLIPIVHFYTKAGGPDATGAQTANPLFENGLELTAAFNLSPRLKLGVPLKLYVVRYRAYQPRAVYNDRWGYTVTTKPELIYQIHRQMMLGVAFETGNLIADNFSDITVTDGVQGGLAQLVFITTL